jgi:hypothetical protein
MQVYPPVEKQEMLKYLTAHAHLIWGDELPFNEQVLDTVAEAMAIVTAIDVPDDVEPLFP